MWAVVPWVISKSSGCVNLKFSMLRPLKNILWIGLMAVGLQSAWGFADIGPGTGGGQAGDAWQTPVIGYGIGGDIGTPKNLGEEYRWVRPVLYYSYDQNFLDYFGTNGVINADLAFAMINGAISIPL